VHDFLCEAPATTVDKVLQEMGMAHTPEKEQLENTRKQLEIASIAPPLNSATLLSNEEFTIVQLLWSMKDKDPPAIAKFPWNAEVVIFTVEV